MRLENKAANATSAVKGLGKSYCGCGARIQARTGKREKGPAMRGTSLLAPVVGGMFLALAAQMSVARVIGPDALVDSVTHDVIAVIRNNNNDRDPAKISRLVEATVVPHFDFTRMTRLAMGRNWRLASPAEQQALIAEFRTLLVHTYSASLALYRDQEIAFEPLHAAPGGAEVSVKSVVKQSDAQPIHIDYGMEKTPDGWKVYDVSIDGISLVITYRDTFANQVRDRGVDGLIKSLMAKNQSNDMLAKQDGS